MYPEAGSHQFTGRQSTAASGPPFGGFLLVVITANTGGLTAQGDGGVQFDELAMDLHAETDRVQDELDTLGERVEFGDQTLAILNLEAARQLALNTCKTKEIFENCHLIGNLT